MKGDMILLGSMGLSMVAVPLAVLLWAGAPLAPLSPTLPPAVAASASSRGEENIIRFDPPEEEPEEGAGWAAGDEGEEDTDREAEEGGIYKSPVKEFRILDRTTGKVAKVSIRDYVRGAIAAEMPATFHQEAMKAQGVAALSYALNMAIAQRENPDETLKGADFSADPQNRQGYMTEKQIKEFYGETAEYNWAKICEAADEACKVVATYEGEPIAAAYHAISSGVTENAANIWEGPVPYLIEADSGWDVLAEGYKTVVTLSQDEVKERLTAAGAVLGQDFTSWLEVEERSPAGYVTKVRAGDLTLHGNELRNILGLRSACFFLSAQTRGFVFEVRGYGHGAGLSQNGADYLARQGKDFRQILHHYYTGIHLQELRY